MHRQLARQIADSISSIFSDSRVPGPPPTSSKDPFNDQLESKRRGRDEARSSPKQRHQRGTNWARKLACKTHNAAGFPWMMGWFEQLISHGEKGWFCSFNGLFRCNKNKQQRRRIRGGWLGLRSGTWRTEKLKENMRSWRGTERKKKERSDTSKRESEVYTSTGKVKPHIWKQITWTKR